MSAHADARALRRAPPSQPARLLSAGPPPPCAAPSCVLGTLALSLATFMNVLDSSIANVSIPAIAGDLGVSPARAPGSSPVFARGQRHRGAAHRLAHAALRRRCACSPSSVLLFVLASWLCGLAPNLEMLIVFRVLQGWSPGR